MEHFNWTQAIPGVGHHYIHIAMAALVTIFILGLAVWGYVALGQGEQAVTPSGFFNIKGFWEVLVEFIVSNVDSVIGHHGRKYVPIFGTIFIFILFNNLAGLLPGFTPATDNINTTVAVGLFVFLIYNALGAKESGVAYFKHFLGPVWWLAPLMLVIELISHIVRPMSLGLRLMGNMTGDHTVLSIFLQKAPFFVPMIFYGLGIFVCFIQAFVFTLLSMVYVGMATEHDH